MFNTMYLQLLLMSVVNGKLVGFIGEYSGFLCYNEKRDFQEYKRAKIINKKMSGKGIPKPERVNVALRRKWVIRVMKVVINLVQVEIMRFCYGNITTLHFSWNFHGINEFCIIGLLISVFTSLLSSRDTKADTFRSKCNNQNAFWLFMKYHVAAAFLMGFIIANSAMLIALIFFPRVLVEFDVNHYSIIECVVKGLIAFFLLFYLTNNSQLFMVPKEYLAKSEDAKEGENQSIIMGKN